MELVRTGCWWVGWSIGRQADCGGGSGALTIDELAVAGRCDHLSPTLSLPTSLTAVSQQQHESLALRDDAGSAAARRRGEERHGRRRAAGVQMPILLAPISLYLCTQPSAHARRAGRLLWRLTATAWSGRRQCGGEIGRGR